MAKLLLIDDDHDFVQLLKFDLNKQGYQIVTAHDGEDGLTQVEAEHPDLIVLDIKMPKMDGYTFVRRLKKNPNTKNIPVVVLTSYEPMRDMFQLEGVQDYIVKSVNMEDLIGSIKKHTS